MRPVLVARTLDTAPLDSPDTEVFSTPPSTPTVSSVSSSMSDNDSAVRPSLSRRSSRPSSLHIKNNSDDWRPDVLVEETSPDVSRISPKTQLVVADKDAARRDNGAAAVPRSSQLTPSLTARPPQMHSMSNNTQPNQRRTADHLALKSPCFVHSLLDKGASLSDWLRMRPGADSEIGVAKALENPQPASNKSTNFSDFTFSSGSSASSPSEVEDDDDVSSLTRQLAETAVSVREMSKQLGRARVRTNIQNVLIITKARDNRLIKLTRELAVYLMNKRRNGGRGLVVYVDHQLRYSKRFDAAGLEREYPDLFVPLPRRRSSSSTSLSSMASGGAKDEFAMMDEGQLRYWTSDMCSRTPHLFDFVVTLGGDGTVLFTSWLFQRIVPPVLPFALGSLGFLTNFDFADYQAAMDTVIDSGIRVNLRMRFTCTVYRAVAPEKGKGRRAVKKGDTGEIMMKNLEKGGWEALEGGWSGTGAGERDRDARCHKDKEIMCFTTRPVESFEVLNDLVVDRGPSPYVSLLELFGDEHHMTTVQADGLTVSTPTGSTAYSLSAGGSLVHPEIPAILITPICPHTLSFRPMLLPDSMELRICVPFNSRSTAWASFDGRGRVELKQGDHIKVTASKFPFPTVCADKQSTDWFHAISRTLKWNERERQKSFVVVEEGAARPKRRKHEQATAAVNGIKKPEAVEEELQEDDEEDEVSDQEEEEEKFDIDDSSPEANGTAETVETVAHEKAMAEEAARARPTARDAAIALSKGNPLLRNNRSRSRGGIDSPGRFAGPHPHPPQVSPRHVSFKRAMAVAEHVSASSSTDSLPMHEAQKGDRDHIHSPQLLSGGRSRIPRDRDVDAESMKTPTPTDATHGSTRRPHSHSAMHDGSTRRAFAVWGHDESDSNASDSDV